MTQFAAFGLPETLLKALTKIGFNEPTPIQAQSIPHALSGRDVLGSASTGTGKTAAFAVPMIAHLIESPRSGALIMTPTRELAVQVLSTIQPLLLMHREIKTACLIGGEPMGKQFAQLNQKPTIVVGTPGRINDHLARGSLRLDQFDFLVLDETDRMLDMGFDVQIEKIIPLMAKKRQTLMFSATIAPNIARLSARYLNNPERVSVGSTNKPATNIKQELVHTTDGNKYTNLLEQLDKRTGSVIVFVKTKHGADKLATRLCREEHRADAIHGDLQQRKRDRVIQNFRDQKYRILVATDVAARGLDIPHIEHVINYDLPQCPEDYIHRIGRTARAGAEGEAVNLITPSDGAKWKAIVRLINPEEARNEKRDYANKGERTPRRKGAWKSDDARKSRRFGGKPEWKKRHPDQVDAELRPTEKKEWKPRENTSGNRNFDNRGFEKRPEWKKRDDQAAGENRGHDQKREWKKRDDQSSGESRPFEKKREWKSRDDAQGNRSFAKKPEWKKRDDQPAGENRGFEKKREWKPRDENQGEKRFEKKREWKPRAEGDFKRSDNASGEKRGFDKKREWKPRDTNDGFTGRSKPEGDKRKSNSSFAKKKPFKFKAHNRKAPRQTAA